MNYSADLFRFYISHSADFGINVDWREKQIQTVKNHINRFYSFITKNINKIKGYDGRIESLNAKYSKIILSKCIRKFIEAESGLKELNLRKYLQSSFYEVFNLLQEFDKYSKDENDLMEVYKIVFPEWIQILSLAMPHLCEELWELMGNTEFLSKTVWGDFSRKHINNELEREFEYISSIVEDILNIKKIVKSGDSSNIYLYTAPKWKYKVFDIIISKKGNLQEIINECKLDSGLMKNKDLISYIKNQIKDRIWEKEVIKLNEEQLLEEYKDHIEQRINNIIIINSEYDPKNRLIKAVPCRAAIYIEN